MGDNNRETEVVSVSTLVVEWIEMPEFKAKLVMEVVSTLVVEWIEISTSVTPAPCLRSPPSWWSGLKSV